MKIHTFALLLASAILLFVPACGGGDTSSSSITGTWQSGDNYFTFGNQNQVSARTAAQNFTGTYTAEDHGDTTDITMTMTADTDTFTTSIQTRATMQFITPNMATYTPLDVQITTSNNQKETPDTGILGKPSTLYHQ